MHVGVMYPDRAMDVAATLGSFVIVRPDWGPGGHGLLDDPVQLDGIRRHNLRVVLHLLFTERRLLDAVYFQEYVTSLAIAVRAHGLTVFAILADEEMYSRLQAGEYDQWDVMRLFDWRRNVHESLRAIRDVRDERIGQIKAVFPGVYVGALESWWSDDPHAYMPLSQKADFLALDPYVAAPITRQTFDAYVTRAVDHLGPRQLMLIVQTFALSTSAWRVMPTAEQLHWWLDLADQRAHVPAVAWFLLDVPTHLKTTMRGLLDNPTLLAAAQSYAAHGQRSDKEW
jgi:hypothetical protein